MPQVAAAFEDLYVRLVETRAPEPAVGESPPPLFLEAGSRLAIYSALLRLSCLDVAMLPQVAAAFEDLYVRLVETSSGATLATLGGAHRAPMRVLAYDLSSSRLAGGAEDGVVTLWDVQVGVRVDARQ